MSNTRRQIARPQQNHAARPTAAAEAPDPSPLIRGYVFDGQLRSFDSIAEAAKAAGVELGPELHEMVKDYGTAFFIEVTEDEPTGDIGAAVAAVPANHRNAVGATGLALIQTLYSRDPALVIDAEQLYLVFVAPPANVERFLATRGYKRVPLDPPPSSSTGRWVVSINRDEELLRTELGIAIRPGTPSA